MIFFTDECFMYKANKLVEAFDRENEIRPLLDHFPAGTPDVEWIPAIAAWDPKPVVVCGDGRILKNKVERQVLKDAGLDLYLFSEWMDKFGMVGLRLENYQSLACNRYLRQHH